MKKPLLITFACGFIFSFNSAAQWSFNGTHIFNSNTGNVGIGTNTPGYLLHVSKNTVAPSIRIQNAGGTGGAAFEMIDDASGADWKFKATNAGGFKIRDNSFGLDVIQIEPNSSANAIYINGNGNVGFGDNSPLSKLTVGPDDKFQVDAAHGAIIFTDDSASIRFPVTAGSNTPMIYMFTSGTQNSDRMVLSHSPAFTKWGIEYHDTSDVIYFRSTVLRRFAFELGSGNLGIGTDNPAFPIDMVGRMRIRATGTPSNLPGIWFAAQDNAFDRAFFGMSGADSTLGIWSQHLNKYTVEFEIMREPRIGINIPAGSPPRSELHLYHTNFGGSNDGVRIQNEGTNLHYWNLYTANSTGDFEFYHTGIKRATIDPTSGAYTAVSDERLKTNINSLGSVLPLVMRLQPKTYQFTDSQDKRFFTGFIAQELQDIFPQFVYYGGDDQVLYTVDYGSMSVIALKAIQEQQAEIEALREEIRELKALVLENR